MDIIFHCPPPDPWYQVYSLVNLIMDREVVKELIQGDFNTTKLKTELARLLNDEDYRGHMLSALDELRERLGGPGASETTAALMYNRLIDKPGSRNP